MNLPYKVSFGGTYRGLFRNDAPVLTALIEDDMKIAWRRLTWLFIPRVRLPRPIGFTSRWFMEGDNWKATW